MPPRTVLLVEDEDDAATLATAHLIDAEVTRVSSLADAENASTGVDAIVVDVGLPDSEGFDTLAHFLESAPQVPVIVLTGSDDPALKLLALEAGAQEFVHKNEIADLRARVEAAVIRQRHRNRALSQALTAGIRAANLQDEGPLHDGTPATRSGLGAALLKDSLPEVFAKMTESYVELLMEMVESRSYASRPRPTSKSRRVVRDIARLNAAPRDLVDLHLAAMDTIGHRTHPERLSAIAEEGRIVLLEALGHLAAYYRDHAQFRPVHEG